MIKRIILSLAVALGLVVGLQAPLASAALFSNSTNEACNGVAAGGTGSGCDAGTAGLNNLLTTSINLFSAVVGIAAVIMVIVGGFKYITSGGDSGKATSARSTILFAIIGLVIVALAQFLVKFVLSNVTK